MRLSGEPVISYSPADRSIVMRPPAANGRSRLVGGACAARPTANRVNSDPANAIRIDPPRVVSERRALLPGGSHLRSCPGAREPPQRAQGGACVLVVSARRTVPAVRNA